VTTRRGVLGGTAALLLRTVAARAEEPGLTLRPGVLRIGTYFVNPPFEFTADGRHAGFEIDLMRAIAARLDLRPEFVDTRWETILRQIRQRRYDCIVGGITITPERRKTLAWSNPYMTTTLSLIVDAKQLPATMTLADLRGTTVGVQAATTDYDAAMRMRAAGTVGSVKVYPFAQIANAITDLQAGRVAAVMKVHPVAAWLVQETPGLRILAEVPDDPQPLGIGFSPDTPNLLGSVNGAQAALRQDGSLDALARRWRVA
jgi:ABC-type amino acid transport substrate-binding protein